MLVTGRATLDRLAQAQAMMKSVGIAIPGFAGNLSELTPPTEEQLRTRR
jgi:hypothetical protein